MKTSVSNVNRKTSNIVLRFQPPHDLVWVRPELDIVLVDSPDGLGWLNREFDSIFGVEVNENVEDSYPSVSVTRLKADCPFCKKGKNQILSGSQWCDHFDWSPDEIEYFAEVLDDRDEWEIRTYDLPIQKMSEAFFRKYGSGKENNARIEETSARNVYGIDRNDLLRLGPTQSRLKFPGLKSKTYTLQPQQDITGVYECPYCGKSFAISLCRDERNAKSEDEAVIRQAISCLLDEESRNEELATSVSFEDDRVTVTLDLPNYRHEFILDIKTGLSTLDGIRDYGLANREEINEHPMIRSGMFSIRNILFEITSYLPVSYEKMRWGSCEQNYRLLVLANRFIDYPSDFYIQMKFEEYFCQICSIRSGLPRHYEDIEQAYRMTGLPNKKSIKRRLYRNPILLFRLIKQQYIPFENADVICNLLDYHDVSEILSRLEIVTALINRANPRIGWKTVAEIKGESNLLHYLINGSSYDVYELGDQISNGYRMRSPEVMKLIAETPLKRLGHRLFCYNFLADNPEVRDTTYEYEPDTKKLEGRFGKYRFKLPNCAMDFVKAGYELHNCMVHHCFSKHMKEDTLFVLILSDDSYIGGIEIVGGSEIEQAYGPCNKPLDTITGLYKAFTEWCKVHRMNYYTHYEIEIE